MHSSVYYRRSSGQRLNYSTVKQSGVFCDAVKWSSSKNDGQDFLTPAGRSSDYGINGSGTPFYGACVLGYLLQVDLIQIRNSYSSLV